MTPTETRILELLKQRGSQTAKQMASELAVSIEHTRRVCRSLADRKLIISIAEKPIVWASAEMNQVIEAPKALEPAPADTIDDLDALIQRAREHNAKLKQGVETLTVEVKRAEETEKKTAELAKLKQEAAALNATIETLKGRLNKLQSPKTASNPL